MTYEKRNQHRGIALWLTGLSGSGKSTLSEWTHQKLFEIGMHRYCFGWRQYKTWYK